MVGTPFKMKGSPMQRNFGIGSPLHDHKKDKDGNIIKHKTTMLEGTTIFGKKPSVVASRILDLPSRVGKKIYKEAKKVFSTPKTFDPKAYEEHLKKKGSKKIQFNQI